MRNGFWIAAALTALLALGCASAENGGTDGDGESVPEEDLEEGTDGDREAETDGDGEEALSLFHNPHDGNLYAAAGMSVITPSAMNFPCPEYMGGTGSGRLAEGTHDDLEARVLVLEQDGVYVVMAALDVVGLSIGDVDRFWDALSDLGVDRDHFIIHSTHTHTGPDTLGVYGPEMTVSGRCDAYIDFLVRTVADLTVDLSGRMVPVTAVAAETQVREPGAYPENLVNDNRVPFVTNDRLLAARLDDGDGNTVATVVNWHTHPETMIELNVYSADFPRWLRARIERELGGVAVYFTGTEGGMSTPLGASIPERTEDGEPVLEGGQPVFVQEDGEVKAWSLGNVAAEHVLSALETARPLDGPLRIEWKPVRIPFDNAIFVIAIEMGVLPAYDELITDDPDFCGFYGCLPQNLMDVRLGRLHILTLPGELLPEISVGRPESSNDWGGDWGEKVYPAYAGYREALPEGDLLMEFGLANNEIGYILPADDYLPNDHPGYYEEYFSLYKGTADLLRDTFSDLLARPDP